MRILAMSAICGALFSGSLQAQSPPVPDWCQQAANAVQGAKLPSPADSAGVGWEVLAGCGSVGNSTFAQLLGTPSAYSETDSARVQMFFALFFGNRQSDLFAALVAAARNSSATEYFRYQAVHSLGGVYTTAYEMDPQSFVVPFPAACGVRMTRAVSTGGPADLPSDFTSQISQTMQGVENDLGTSTRVRALAHCWNSSFAQLASPNTANILLSYVCNHRFRVQNSNPMAVALTADVIGPTALSPKETYGFTAQPGFDLFFETSLKGTVRLFLNGVVIKTAANGGTACH
jgi:hypothetical protein